MKNRIISLILAFSVFFGVFSAPKRAHAAAAAVTIVSLGVLAWEILDIMIKGEEPAIIVGMRTLIESGVDALTNPDSYFQQTYGDFWNDYSSSYDAIYNLALEMVQNGEISISNGKVNLTYDQYKQFFDVSYSFVSDIGVEFNSPYNYFIFDYPLSVSLPVMSLPVNDLFFKSDDYQSYCLMYYNDTKAIFSDTFVKFRENVNGNYDVTTRILSSSYVTTGGGFFFTNHTLNQMDIYDPFFYYSSLSSFSGGSSNKVFYTRPSSFCFVFENGNVTYQSISSIDVSGFKTAIVSSTGNFGDFLQSLISLKVFEPVSATFDDLSTVLPVEDSPVLSFPINPDLSVPIPDQVTVTTPTAANVPIADYLNPVITDIETPSIILEKFPFCIPYDFIRIIGVLAADPVAPVFHIPISTHPNNLEQFAGNETIGDYVSSDDPLFEIDEDIVIDLSHIPLIQPICYTIFIVGFVILLIKLTPKLIQH